MSFCAPFGHKKGGESEHSATLYRTADAVSFVAIAAQSFCFFTFSAVSFCAVSPQNA
jgi:hypothetical protein